MKKYLHSMTDFYEDFWKNRDIPKDYVYKVSLIKRLVPKGKGLKVLDYGCGNGIFIKEMLSVNPSLEIVGADISRYAITTAKKKFPKLKLYSLSEGKKLPFKDRSFDYIFALDVFLCIYDTEFIFKELSRLLKPKGKLIITLPYYGILKNIVISLIGFEKVYDPRGHIIRYYTPKSLKREIKDAKLTPITFGYFGRFYPFSNGMYCIAEKD